MKFSEVLKEMEYVEVRREFSINLDRAMENLDALAKIIDKHPELSTESREFYNRIIMQLIDAHPLIKYQT